MNKLDKLFLSKEEERIYKVMKGNVTMWRNRCSETEKRIIKLKEENNRLKEKFELKFGEVNKRIERLEQTQKGEEKGK